MTLVIARHPDRTGQGYIFAPVLGMVDQTGVQVIHDADEFAPPRGTIFVPPNLVPENFGSLDLACWEVVEDYSYNDGDPNGAKLRARRLDQLPTEIVDVHASSLRGEDAVKLLCEEGLQFNFNINGRSVYIQFSDGVIAGPITFTRSDESGRSICDDAQFAEPITAWKSGALFETVLFTAEGKFMKAHRRFVSTGYLPAHTDYVDFAPLGQAIQSLVRRVCRDGPGSFIIPKREQALLVERLTSIQLPAQLEARRRRLQSLLNEALKTGADLEQWYPLVCDHPSVKARIEERAQEAAAEARKELQAEAGELKSEIKTLEGKIEQLKSDIRKIEEGKKKVSQQAKEAGEAIHNVIINRAEAAVKDVEGILAQTAVLRPFLSTSGHAGVSLIKNREVNQPSPALDISQAQTNLTAVFRQLGLIPGDATFVARGVIAAAICGQLIRFSGSMAEILARSAVRSIGADLIIGVEVPPVLMNSHEIKSALDEFRSTPRGGSFVLFGINNACFDLFGGPITELVVKRTLDSEAVTSQVLCVGTVGNGAASLCIGPIEASLGPIFDTDCLSWSTRKGTTVIPPGQLTEFAISVTSQEDQSPQEDLNRALQAFGAFQPALWRRCAFQAFSTLRHLCFNDVPAAAAILTYGWILPLAEALDRDSAEVKDIVSNAFAGALESTEALPRLLERKRKCL